MAPSGNDDSPRMWRDFDTGWIMTTELITATFVWGGVGWLVDRWLDTEPWAMVGGFTLGSALGMYLIFLRASQMGAEEDKKRAEL